MRKLLNGSSSSAVCRRCNSRNRANLTPDKSKSEAGAPQQGPGQEVPKAGTGTGAGTGGTAKSNWHNPEKTEERHPLNAVTILNGVLFFCVC